MSISEADAFMALQMLGAPRRLVVHAQLVLEAADLILAALDQFELGLRTNLVRAGAILHDAGKAVVLGELNAPGHEHEPAGLAALTELGLPADVCAICESHADWQPLSRSLEELLVTLADKLWKGKRIAQLEERVIKIVAEQAGMDLWAVYPSLDEAFEAIAGAGDNRLSRSV